MRILASLVGCLLVFGCGDEGVPEANPVGVVQGEVLDGATFAGLSDVTIHLFVGDNERVTTTNTEGRFVLKSIPAGSMLGVDFEKPGYARARSWAMVNDSAGEHPQSNSIEELMILLFPNDYRLTVRVVDAYTQNGVSDIEVTGTVVGAPSFAGFSSTQVLDRLHGRTGSSGELELEGIALSHSYRLITTPTERYRSGTGFYNHGFEPPEEEIAIVPYEASGGDPDGGVAPDAGSGWQCDPTWYNEGSAVYCDCGCGIPDPDCEGGGCAALGCCDPATCAAMGCVYCGPDEEICL